MIASAVEDDGTRCMGFSGERRGEMGLPGADRTAQCEKTALAIHRSAPRASEGLHRVGPPGKGYPERVQREGQPARDVLGARRREQPGVVRQHRRLGRPQLRSGLDAHFLDERPPGAQPKTAS